MFQLRLGFTQPVGLTDAASRTLAAYMREARVNVPAERLAAADVIYLFGDHLDYMFAFLEGVVDALKGRIIHPKVRGAVMPVAVMPCRCSHSVLGALFSNILNTLNFILSHLFFNTRIISFKKYNTRLPPRSWSCISTK